MLEDEMSYTALPVLLDEEAKGYMRASKAENTVRAYRSDWNAFSAWCDERGVPSLPATPEALAVYLAAAARTLKPSTLTRRCSSISMAHQMAGYESPTRSIVVRTTLAGIRREKGTAPNQKSPVLTADLRGMVAALPESLAGTRDRALLLLGFAGALRRSELVGLDVEDVDDRSDGLVITVVRSKTDQEGAGRKIGIPYGSYPDTCPVRAVRAWLERSGIEEGPLFRPVRHGRVLDSRLSGRSVALIVKRVGATVGFDPINYAGHSLRAGLVTSAAAAGVEERIIMNQTGHKSLPTLRRYVRDASLFRNNAAAAVGLSAVAERAERPPLVSSRFEPLAAMPLHFGEAGAARDLARDVITQPSPGLHLPPDQCPPRGRRWPGCRLHRRPDLASHRGTSPRASSGATLGGVFT